MRVDKRRAAVSALLVGGLMALAALSSSQQGTQNFPCATALPLCDEDQFGPGSDPGCLSGWDPQPGPVTIWVYHCNGSDSRCGAQEGLCNVMVETETKGHILSCDGVEHFCVESLGGSTPLNTRCDTGYACDESEPADPIPSGYPPAGGMPTLYADPIRDPAGPP